MIDLAELTRIKRVAEAMLTEVVHGPADSIVKALRPRDEDYTRVFIGHAAEAARTGYAALWSAPPPSLAKPGQTQVIAFPCDAGSLRTHSEFSAQFPGGYKQIAGFLAPELVWLVFKTVVPGQTTGMSFDGLVYLDDHWAFFPKPWRVLSSGDSN